VPAPTQPPSPETAPAGSAAAPPATQPSAVPAKPAMFFLEFWLAMGQTGREGYARAQWGRLTATDKVAIRDRLGRPRSWATDMWAGKWLECRVWEETVPAAVRPEQVFVRENTPEWRCWQRHLVATKGKGTPVNSQGGWWFSSRLPPLTDAEVPSKGQAPRATKLRSMQRVAHSISHDGGRHLLCVEHDDAGDRRAQPEKTKEAWE
jgi:hypothetical protein